jgi:hypothetical protein
MDVEPVFVCSVSIVIRLWSRQFGLWRFDRHFRCGQRRSFSCAPGSFVGRYCFRRCPRRNTLVPASPTDTVPFAHTAQPSGLLDAIRRNALIQSFRCRGGDGQTSMTSADAFRPFVFHCDCKVASTTFDLFGRGFHLFGDLVADGSVGFIGRPRDDSSIGFETEFSQTQLTLT